MTASIAELQCRRRQLVDSDSPDLDLALLLCHCLNKPRSYLYAWPEYQLSDAELAAFESLFQRRLSGEPMAHIVGEREFWSLPLEVNNSTLIPRPDTECLVEQALALALALAQQKNGRILDLGTGSGAIALALASELPGWQLFGVDRLEDAVKLARRNGEKLALSNASFARSDWFAELAGQRFDLIVSNPPYIDAGDPHLQQGDVRFEPPSALVAGKHGLADIELIIDQAPGYLHAGGWLLLEHGYQQAEAVAEIFLRRGFESISCTQDYAGQPRVSRGRWPG